MSIVIIGEIFWREVEVSPLACSTLRRNWYRANLRRSRRPIHQVECVLGRTSSEIGTNQEATSKSRKQRGVRGLRITRSAVRERSAHPEGQPRTNHTYPFYR